MKCEKCGHETESLAVLADRKGYSLQIDKHPSGTWSIGVVYWGQPHRKPAMEPMFGSYHEAEAKAKSYLRGLPDVKQEEGR